LLTMNSLSTIYALIMERELRPMSQVSSSSIKFLTSLSQNIFSRKFRTWWSFCERCSTQRKESESGSGVGLNFVHRFSACR
jgi:hypothetical protein